MTIQYVVYTEIIYAIAIMLLELPTGILADKWGRKPMVVLAACMGCLEFFLLLHASQFWHFALVVVLAAAGSSAASGTETALLYDSLAANGRERAFEKIVGRMRGFDLVATMLAALGGSWLAHQFGFAFNYWLSLFSMGLCLLLTCLLIEPVTSPSATGQNEEPLPVKQFVRQALLQFRDRPGLLLVVLAATVTGAAINFIDEFWQIYLDRIGISVLYFGLFSAAIYFLQLPGSLLAYRLRDIFGCRPLLLIILAGLTLGFGYMAAVPGTSSIAALFLICLFAGMIEPLAAGYLHHRIDSSMRATMGSFQSFGTNAAIMGTGLGFGFASARWDIFGGYGLIAVLCGGFLTYFFFASKRQLD
ncbi:MFS transporter [Xylanibacillus composti]|uniref:MFS transporter n=2 Tax=Xylanibacillus composti TaxID=1572762 RepID=A0A8J4M3Y7_9BACL|nr:MFS transporter [Xylanibacillus composti]